MKSLNLYLFTLILLIGTSVVYPLIQKRKLRSLVQKSIGIDRICRLCDISQNDIEFSVQHHYSSTSSNGVRYLNIKVQFYYRLSSLFLTSEHDACYVGDAVTICTDTSSKPQIEVHIANQIIKIKEYNEALKPNKK